MIHIPHEGGVVEAEELGLIPVIEVLANDFLLDKHCGSCHLVLRELSDDGRLITLWDCDGQGHTYNIKDSVKIARPSEVKDQGRVWPDDDRVKAWLAEAAKFYEEHDEDEDEDEDDDWFLEDLAGLADEADEDEGDN